MTPDEELAGWLRALVADHRRLAEQAAGRDEDPDGTADMYAAVLAHAKLLDEAAAAGPALPLADWSDPDIPW